MSEQVTAQKTFLDSVKERGESILKFLTQDKYAPWFLLFLSVFNIAVSAIAVDALRKIKQRSVQEENNYRYAWMILIANIVFGVIAVLNINFENLFKKN
jgi:hypothetical protein